MTLIDLARAAVGNLAAAAAVGADIDADPNRFRDIMALPVGRHLNALGTPASGPECGLAYRCALYEALGAIDPNLVFAAPGPVMAGIAVAHLGSEAQQLRFFERFTHAPTWTCFAMTERHAGSDTASIQLRASPRAGGGYRLDGEKYMVGQGVNASLMVVFARTSQAVLGTAVFLIEPERLAGLRAERLPVIGCRGSNLSRLVFDGVEVAEEARLGTHLRPTVMARIAASAVFDSLRPCVGAVALGLARGTLNQMEALGCVPAAARGTMARHRSILRALFQRALALSAAADQGRVQAREAGLCKAQAATAARAAIDAAIEYCPRSAVLTLPWLRRAWRDVRAFEYAEGVTPLHLLHGADLFRTASHAAGD